VIVGDPRQLRHVSFLGDDRRDAALRAARIPVDAPVAAKLDVRRNSTFDLGAGVSPVIMLDEHFRGSPHLVDFVARRIYRGDLHVATRSPATASLDCIDVVRVEGSRDRRGVVTAEVDEVVRRLHHLRSSGATDVGVVTPFRAQAEGLEAAVLKAFDADDLMAMDLRVGTAHGFQGIERDVVLIPMGVGSGADKAWPFVEDPHLLAVLLTRARRQVVVVLAGEPPTDGLVADYLRQADAPPGPPRPVGGPSPWVDALADDLGAAGVRVVAGYPTGGHVVDLCLGDERSFCGVVAAVHRDGAIAHVDRQLALRRAGWPLRDAFPSRWAERRGELLVELGLAVRRHDGG